MKHIRIGVVLLGLCYFFSIGASGQTETIVNSETSGNDSLVHVAYSSVNKNDLSNAISVLNPSEYLDKNYGTYGLDGSVALIGGSNLWNLGNALVLIDGVERSSSQITSSEIDQITFLKGANAVVLYGSRAANGVILITSKHGVEGKQQSNVYVNTGINIPKSYPEYLGSAEYMKFFNQASLNDGLEPQYDDETIDNFASHSNLYRYPDVDYYSSDYLRKMFNYTTANADFSGGNERARFYAAAGMQNQNSLLNFGEGKNDNLTRLNIRGNVDLTLNDYITTYVNVSTIFYDLRTANGNYLNNASSIQPHRFSPLVPTDLIEGEAADAQVLVEGSRHIIDGKYLLGGSQEYLTNPISDVYAAGYSTYTSRQFQYSSGLDIDLRNALKGLSFHGQMSIDYSNTYTQSIDNTYAVYVPEWESFEGADSIADVTKYNKESNTGNQNLGGIWNNQLIDFNVHFDYVNTFKEKHNVYAMLVASGVRNRMTGDFQYRTNANLGLQLTYNYAHKYYADFSGAIINSTKLPVGKRVAFSPTLSLGWLLSDEDFLKGSNVVDRLKLSASAGIINTDLDFYSYYMYDAVYSSTAYHSWSDGDYVNRATTISRGDNQNLTYAKRKEINFGIESSLFNKLLYLQANAFVIKKDGIPVQSYTQYPSFFRTGWPETSFVPFTNFEAISYKGFDFQLNLNKKVGELDLSLGLTGTYVATEALKRDELYADSYRNRVGKPTDALFGLQSEGFFMDQAEIDNHSLQKFGEVKPGDLKYTDQNDDGVIDERDEVMIGHWNSPLTGGLNFTAQWKNFTFFALGTAWFGGTAINNRPYNWVYGDRKYSTVVRDSWTEETKNTATYPRLTTLSSDNNFRTSDFWTYSSNRINISKVQLTYSLPDKVLQNSFVKGLNIYVSGANLLTISKNKDIMELNVGTSPQTRFYNLGVKAVF
ncbi:MAG: SusC/RagA family TonB-linked outer membrane protein [Prolixibacteraceae bacterium]|jgi:TonB-linked SusC/RagA family outer membrane protein|nr:SusC/RagA family TonB-linked outer membrane protein [Prolixibacteraceae bacterium]